ncbi:PREDICTED: uncharacterized protein LOC106813039 [Priapulus caudatus]|uniref:Uncharacterized protein LOC106813039 n=1 Tax=Priapulus caudatus TaxID=37621 RepID=A0ABM1EK49_PRICU|nr:PREDICTED: uncharacterized protein LOC106813039 [Priapulus caudatus]
MYFVFLKILGPSTGVSLDLPLLNDSLLNGSTDHDDTLPYDGIIPASPDGFTLVFDNVNQKTHARYSSRERGNVMFNMVQAYAAVDRIPCMRLADHQPAPDDIELIPMDSFFPDAEDYSMLP